MRTIPLTQGQVALVDDADFDWLNQWKWYAWWNRATKSFYAVRNGSWHKGKRDSLRMSRVIMNAPKGVVVDHRDHDTLNNQRGNLRLANHSQNGANRAKLQKGIYREGNSWYVKLAHKRTKVYVGAFHSEQDAIRAYNEKAQELYGEFARLKTN